MPGFRQIPHRHKVLFAAIGALSLVLIGAGAGAVVLLSGAYSTAATKQHFWITYRILDLGLRYSIARQTRGIEAPDLSDPETIHVGVACYRRYCEQCHGAPGYARDAAGKGMLPAPTPLAHAALNWTAEDLYYVTKQGVRMTGMPAWEYRMSDSALWATTAFLKAMPQQTQRQYLEMVRRTEGVACPPDDASEPYSVTRVQTVLRQYACDSCHIIDGLVGARTYVGPPLENFGQRKLIAGVLPNTRENLVRWLMEPQAVSPGTLMPDMGVPEPRARDMAIYLLGVD